MTDERRKDLVDRFWSKVRNRPLLAAVFVIGVAVIAIGQFTDAVEKTIQFVNHRVLGHPSEDALQGEYCELLAPMMVQLDRTKAAFDRWTEQNLYLEAKIIREGNIAVRDLLIGKAELVRPELQEDARRLVEHYDRWLEEFDRVRGGTEPDLQTPFVFVGPKGFPFPRDSEERFRQRHRKLQEQLGPDLACS